MKWPRENYTFPIKGNKKAANRNGLAAQDRSVSYFLYWLCIYWLKSF